MTPEQQKAYDEALAKAKEEYKKMQKQAKEKKGK